MALYLDYTGLSYYDNKVKVWVTDRIKNLTGFTAKAVDALPETGEDNIIYLVKNDESTETQNVYDEYLWINGAFEKLKSTDKIDLSDYYTAAYTNETTDSIATIDIGIAYMAIDYCTTIFFPVTVC